MLSFRKSWNCSLELLGAEVGKMEKRFNAELKRLDDKIAALQAEIEILRGNSNNARNITPMRTRDVA